MLSSTVTPARDNPLRMSTTFAALVLSSPVVGSSRNMIPGLVSSSVAMETLRFSPPLSPRVNSSPIRLSATFTRPNSRIHPATTLYASLLAVSGGNRSAALNIRCSHTVDVPGSTSVCCTYPLACRTSRADTASPSSLTVPCATCPRGVRPARKSSSVDFPAPDGPRIAKSPDTASSESSVSADTGVVSSPLASPLSSPARSVPSSSSVTTVFCVGPAYPETFRRIRFIAPDGLDGVTLAAYTLTLSQLIVVARASSSSSSSYSASASSSGIDSSVEPLAWRRLPPLFRRRVPTTTDTVRT
mmetsp:Transcript_4169/g.18732  ORF Transcript_4169/g.18732 Transcript_4169/m.18732 type:complete len:301 (-) Transcript_4169:1429-2331(-)